MYKPDALAKHGIVSGEGRFHLFVHSTNCLCTAHLLGGWSVGESGKALWMALGDVSKGQGLVGVG